MQRPRILLVSMGSPRKSSYVARLAWLKEHPERQFEVINELGWPFSGTAAEYARSFHEIARAREEADIVVLHRVLFPRSYRRRFFSGDKPVIFDFDDAIYSIPSGTYRDEIKSPAGWVKRLWRIASRGRPDFAGRYWPLVKMLKCVDAVSAGSPHLAAFSAPFVNRVEVVPTVVDVSNFKVKQYAGNETPVTIGWYGSPDNQCHLDELSPVFQRLEKRFGAAVRFEVISSSAYSGRNVTFHWTPWDAAREVDDLLDFDIGIMPLADDEWARGKCGNKAIYYMAAEIPTVLSPVGVNADLVENGVTGFAASTHEEWFESLARLVESRDLRQTLGRNARAFVLDQYSREVAVDRFSKLVHSTLQNHTNGN